MARTKSAVNELKINPVPVSKPEIGIDTEKSFLDNIIGAAEVGALDISSIDALTQSAQSREQSYELIDCMAQDDVISSVLETYAEDVVQTNDKGQVVWIEAEDSKILNYASWLVDSLNVDKHLYQWTYCLITYGDVYIRLYRKSDVEEDKLFRKPNKMQALNEGKEPSIQNLTEEAQIKIYASSDKYIPYVQMVDNPGEMFDLQKFGKTHGFIKAPVRVIQQTSDELYNYLTRYKMKQSEVEIYDAMTFVHGCLETTNQRQPETVDIYLDNYKNNPEYQNDGDEYDDNDSMTSSYVVKRGQSLLYNSFRIWRELNLLEMSALLNRLTKSSVVRVLNIDVGDMPKEQVQNFLQRLKEKIEQKAAINTGTGMAEYTAPAPIENTIYIPTHEGKGAITPTTIGGDFDPKSLVDLEYFRDKLFGSLKVPKQFFGFTEDGAGFNGGTSLTILSARYGKAIKNIQNVLCQMITDLINLFLIDRGLDNYVNKFRVRMQEPVTQEEIDKRANNDNRIRYVGDLMQQLTDIEDKATRLKIYKALIGSTVNDPEVIGYIQEYIESLEAAENKSNQKSGEEVENELPSLDAEEEPAEEETLPEPSALESFVDEDKDVINEAGSEDEEDSYLPSPDELNLDLTSK